MTITLEKALPVYAAAASDITREDAPIGKAHTAEEAAAMLTAFYASQDWCGDTPPVVTAADVYDDERDAVGQGWFTNA